jgi:hypothetical protein
MPSAKEADDISINMCTEEGHSTSSVERVGIDVGRKEAEQRAK